MISEDAFDETVPEETPAPMSVLLSVSSTPPPSLNISVSEKIPHQPIHAQIPVAESVPETPTRISLGAAREPVSKSPTQIPVALSEIEPPPQVQQKSETVAKNSPAVWANTDAQPKREKPQIGLTFDLRTF